MFEREKLQKIVNRFNTEKNCMTQDHSLLLDYKSIRNKVNYEIL